MFGNCIVEVLINLLSGYFRWNLLRTSFKFNGSSVLLDIARLAIINIMLNAC